MTSPAPERAPTPIHRAIDQVTILKIELRQLGQRLRSGETIDPDCLSIMDTALDEVAAVLLAIRDRDASS